MAAGRLLAAALLLLHADTSDCRDGPDCCPSAHLAMLVTALNKGVLHLSPAHNPHNGCHGQRKLPPSRAKPSASCSSSSVGQCRTQFWICVSVINLLLTEHTVGAMCRGSFACRGPGLLRAAPPSQHRAAGARERLFRAQHQPAGHLARQRPAGRGEASARLERLSAAGLPSNRLTQVCNDNSRHCGSWPCGTLPIEDALGFQVLVLQPDIPLFPPAP